MNKQMKNILLAGILFLLFSACGPLQTTPASANTPDPVDINPTAAVDDGLAPEKFSKYIGLSYPPLPAGLTEGFSMVIQDSSEHGLLLVSDTESKMLWLITMTHRDSSGNAYWTVKDILELSDAESGSILIPDGCLLNGEVDNEIFVVSKNEEILLAWRANTALNVFEVIPTNGIECRSDKGVRLE